MRLEGRVNVARLRVLRFDDPSRRALTCAPQDDRGYNSLLSPSRSMRSMRLEGRVNVARLRVLRFDGPSRRALTCAPQDDRGCNSLLSP